MAAFCARSKPSAANSAPWTCSWCVNSRSNCSIPVLRSSLPASQQHGTADASVKSIFKTSLHTGFCGACFFTRDVSTAASYAARHAGTRRRVVIFAVALEEHEAAESVRIIYTPAGHARSRRHLPLASALLPERDQPTLH